MAEELVVYVAETGADAQRVDLVTGYLRHDLIAAGADVSIFKQGQAPPGTRAIDAAVLGALLIRLGQSSGVRSVVTGIIHWLNRSPNHGRTVRVEIDGDVLVLSEATAAEEARLVDLFVARHVE